MAVNSEIPEMVDRQALDAFDDFVIFHFVQKSLQQFHGHFGDRRLEKRYKDLFEKSWEKKCVVKA